MQEDIRGKLHVHVQGEGKSGYESEKLSVAIVVCVRVIISGKEHVLPQRGRKQNEPETKQACVT
jgi:hypothetical protein